MSNSMISLVGATSNIAQRFKEYYPQHKFIELSRKLDTRFNVSLDSEFNLSLLNLSCDGYIITLGSLIPKTVLEQSDHESLLSLKINLLIPIKICEYLIEYNPNAKIVVIGSESATKGSHDTTYFTAKAGLNAYVRERRIKYAGQSLNLIEPSVIADTAMTQKRHDSDVGLKNSSGTPKGRQLLTKDICALISLLLSADGDYISNQTIGINGGKFTRMGVK